MQQPEAILKLNVHWTYGGLAALACVAAHDFNAASVLNMRCKRSHHTPPTNTAKSASAQIEER